MRPHFIEIRDSETQKSIIVDMEGPYHRKDERPGEHNKKDISESFQR